MPDQGACNDPETWGLVVQHQGSTFINACVKLLQTWLIETEGNEGVMHTELSGCITNLTVRN